VVTKSSSQFQEKFQAGKIALEQGRYRLSVENLEEAIQLVTLGSREGGEAQLWLVMAYQATGKLTEATNLCRKLTRHPDGELRKQSKQVLFILEAPQLTRPKEWMTEIPDLNQVASNHSPSLVQATKNRRRSVPPPPVIRFEDTSKINTEDNGFIVVILLFLLCLLGGIIWFS
jgi:hypothetical protein